MDMLSRIEDSVDRDNARAKRKKEKKEWTTKQWFVPAIDVLDDLKHRSGTVYPVIISFLVSTFSDDESKIIRGGSLKIIRNSKDFDKYITLRDMDKQNLLRMSVHNGLGTYVDFGINGRYSVDKTYKPEINHLEKLNDIQVYELISDKFGIE